MANLPQFPQTPEPLLRGADAWVHGMIGIWRRRSAVLRRLSADAAVAEKMSAQFMGLDDSALREKLAELKGAVRRNPSADAEIIPTALAAVREAARRTLGLHPFPVQLLGALALCRGNLAEMATGEGKTLTAGVAAVLLAWQGRPCHVITVNDYLVERDAKNMSPLFKFCGVTVSHLLGEMDQAARREAYGTDVTYGTSKEFAADFLRDQLNLGAVRDPNRRMLRGLLRPRQENLVMRGLHCAIVDEADSLLIDEAVTPLIISARSPNEDLREAVVAARDLADAFRPGEHYQCESRHRDVLLTSEGEQLVSTTAEKMSGIWRKRDRSQELIRQALIAREYYQEGQQFMVRDGKIVIVDEFTGRPMPDRTWRMGLHQAVEAKEGVEVTDPTETVARISFQRFFRHYKTLCGMTGTAWEARDELWRVYGLPVVRIPTNRPCVRQTLPFQFYRTEGEKLDAMVREIKSLHASGSPVLVGTRTVRASEALAVRLEREGMMPQVLNATKLKEEAMIVSQAGQPAKLTIATNMAGRGTDIKLAPGIAEAGGLHVLAAERHESGRVDRQLHGRCARQGDPGIAQSFASMEDELMVKFAPKWLGWLPTIPGGGKLLASYCQRSAQRQAFRQRKRVLEADTWLEQSLSFAEK